MTRTSYDYAAGDFRVLPAQDLKQVLSAHSLKFLVIDGGGDALIGWREIATSIAQGFNLSLCDVIGRSRHRHIVRCRRAVMYILVRRGNSHSQVGRWLRRDHSTVIYAVDQFKRLATADELAVVDRHITT